MVRRLALMLSSLLLALLSASPVHAQETVLVDFTITNVTLDGSGGLIVTGVLTCSEPGEAFVRVDASEQVGRTLVFGTAEASDFVVCGPTGTSVTVPVPAQVGAFRPGRVNVTVSTFVCAPDFAICSSGGQDSTELTLPVTRR